MLCNTWANINYVICAQARVYFCVCFFWHLIPGYKLHSLLSIHSLTHLLTNSLIHSFTHSFINLFINSLPDWSFCWCSRDCVNNSIVYSSWSRSINPAAFRRHSIIMPVNLSLWLSSLPSLALGSFYVYKYCFIYITFWLNINILSLLTLSLSSNTIY